MEKNDWLYYGGLSLGILGLLGYVKYKSYSRGKKIEQFTNDLSLKVEQIASTQKNAAERPPRQAGRSHITTPSGTPVETRRDQALLATHMGKDKPPNRINVITGADGWAELPDSFKLTRRIFQQPDEDAKIKGYKEWARDFETNVIMWDNPGTHRYWTDHEMKLIREGRLPTGVIGKYDPEKLAAMRGFSDIDPDLYDKPEFPGGKLSVRAGKNKYEVYKFRVLYSDAFSGCAFPADQVVEVGTDNFGAPIYDWAAKIPQLAFGENPNTIDNKMLAYMQFFMRAIYCHYQQFIQNKPRHIPEWARELGIEDDTSWRRPFRGGPPVTGSSFQRLKRAQYEAAGIWQCVKAPFTNLWNDRRISTMSLTTLMANAFHTRHQGVAYRRQYIPMSLTAYWISMGLDKVPRDKLPSDYTPYMHRGW